ncbi:MAG: BrnT family toxin, partial [Nitrospira sp. SB0667_bin_9]|nr:BrnT family toxin [Nitrospira sp. SB0667_bin_9]
MFSFEFDKRKSQLNLKKHGIDFDQAQALWHDPHVVEIQAKTEDETRLLVIGRIRGKHWSAIVTTGGGRIRIISVRRSHAEEVLI